MSDRITITQTTRVAPMGRTPAAVLWLILLLIGLVVNPGLAIVVGLMIWGWRSRVGEMKRTRIAEHKHTWGDW